MSNPIKIIDLFAGPGGLGEGFSAFKSNNKHPFEIAISIEKEASAHRTLTLRAFFRQFKEAPKEYYDFLRGKLGTSPEEKLYKIPRFKKQLEAAESEARCLTLGEDNKEIDKSVKAAIGSDDCILIGGPPCQAYSLAGRSRNMGIKDYKAEDDHRNFLYKEYLRIIAKFQPAIFIMENVKGMLSANIDGNSIYETIFCDLHNPCKALRIRSKLRFPKNYKIVPLVTPVKESKKINPKDFIIKTELFGVPQRRHRVILLGIREDLADSWNSKMTLTAMKAPKLSDVISDLPKLRSGLSKEVDGSAEWIKAIKTEGKKTVKALNKNSNTELANEFSNILNKLNDSKLERGLNFSLKRSSKLKSNVLRDWYYDKKLGKHICNHATRGHMTSDLQRYLFCSIWAQIYSSEDGVPKTPKSKDYPDELMPNHKNFKSGKFEDRFRVQPWYSPATTITSHISKDGHYFIHPDPMQCRSLTVREAARIQTFPDNYFFVGNRTQQYVQVGNAVPPLLAKTIAGIVYSILSPKKSESKSPEPSIE